MSSELLGRVRRARRARGFEHLAFDEEEGHRNVIHVSITIATDDTRIEVTEDNERAGLVTADAREQAVLALMAATSRVLRLYGHNGTPTAEELAAAAHRLDNPPPIDQDPLPLDPVHPQVTVTDI